MLQLLIIGVWSFFPSYIGDYQNAQMRLACSSSVHHHLMPHNSPLEASSIPLLSPGSLLAPPPDNVQDAGSPVTHDDDVTDVTVQGSHSHDDHHSAVISSLSLYIMTVVSYNTVTQDSPGLTDVRAPSLTSSLARGGGLTEPRAGPRSAEPQVERDGQLRSWPSVCASVTLSRGSHTKRLSNNCHFPSIQAQEGN